MVSSIALLNRRDTRMDGDGGKGDRSFGIKVDRSFEPQMHVDGRGWGKGRFTIGIATARTQVAVGQ
ncbi:hypothetical protein K4039_28650 [Lyngbya sp. CCAP 1446/10]|uniref:hypothetical protein n=1 Tax=Microcoleaceae TaxID=1892252 RepID=UPI0022383B56|nr:hypothetical protein [Lyngbya sp. CCAP 1446/10]MCW6053914.1 hypothetical protein [Lyngbya sp. CCAP 1446/10]